jgi:RNA polymerase sigma-70 factor (ECF subfamily)
LTARYIDMPDEGLMALIAKDDHQAFAVLVERHTQRFFNTAYRYCPHVETAEDIVQDAFVKLWTKREKWDPTRGAKFTTWFTRIVTNQALDVLRKNKPEYDTDRIEMFESTNTAADEHIMHMQRAQALEQAIAALPDRQKTALNLCTYDGFSNKETAQAMDIGVKALESLLMRAKQGIKTYLMREGLLQDKAQERGLKTKVARP